MTLQLLTDTHIGPRPTPTKLLPDWEPGSQSYTVIKVVIYIDTTECVRLAIKFLSLSAACGHALPFCKVSVDSYT